MAGILGFVSAGVAALAACSGFSDARADDKQADARASHRHEMVSWVLLYSAHSVFDVNDLRQKLDAAFPGEFLPQRDGKSFILDGPTPGQFLIQSRIVGAAGLFMVMSVAAPYTQFSDFANFIDDPALRHQAVAQRNWLSIDLIAKATNPNDAYRFIGRALARLAPADAAMLVHPTRPIVMTFDESTQRLANGLQPD